MALASQIVVKARRKPFDRVDVRLCVSIPRTAVDERLASPRPRASKIPRSGQVSVGREMTDPGSSQIGDHAMLHRAEPQMVTIIATTAETAMT